MEILQLLDQKKKNVSRVLSENSLCGDVYLYDQNENSEPIYEIVKPFFQNMNLGTKKIILGYKGGSAQDMLTRFRQATDEVVLMMAIEALPRFEVSDSFKKWWARENGPEYSVTGLFSFHASSRRTVALDLTTGKHIEPLWSDKSDIFQSIVHCLNKFPVASAIIRSISDDSAHYPMVFVSEEYAKIFDLTPSNLLHHSLNLLTSEKVSLALSSQQPSKLETEYLKKLTTNSLAVAIKPIRDQNGHCIYFYVIVTNMSSQSFCMESLKLSTDLFDILPPVLIINFWPQNHPYPLNLHYRSHKVELRC
jgi:hypothetical protein